MVIWRALCNIIGNWLPRILIKLNYSRCHLNGLSIQSSFRKLRPLLDCIGRSVTNTRRGKLLRDHDSVRSCYGYYLMLCATLTARKYHIRPNGITDLFSIYHSCSRISQFDRLILNHRKIYERTRIKSIK